MKKQQVDLLDLILAILLSMREFTETFQFCVDQGLRLEPNYHYFLYCNGFITIN